MRLNLLFLSAASNALLKLGGLEVEEAVSKRRKVFAAAHRSDEGRHAYISASRRALSVIAKAKTEAWQMTCSSLSPTVGLTLNLCTLFFALSLALLSSLPPLLTFLTVLPGNRLRSMPHT